MKPRQKRTVVFKNFEVFAHRPPPKPAAAPTVTTPVPTPAAKIETVINPLRQTPYKVETNLSPPKPTLAAPAVQASPPAPGGLLDGKEIRAVQGQTHHPRSAGYLGSFKLHRCLCGLFIAQSRDGELWWCPARGGVFRIGTLDYLARVLTTDCWHSLQRQAGEEAPDIDIQERRLD